MADFVKYMQFLTALAIGIGVVVYAARPGTPIKPSASAPPVTAPAPAEKVVKVVTTTTEQDSTDNWCDVYISEANARDVLVFDKNQQALANVKQVFIWVNIGASQPTVKLYSWPGLYRPSHITEETRPLRNVRVLSADDFQKAVDTAGRPPVHDTVTGK
jgi:hypothetical protein